MTTAAQPQASFERSPPAPARSGRQSEATTGRIDPALAHDLVNGLFRAGLILDGALPDLDDRARLAAAVDELDLLIRMIRVAVRPLSKDDAKRDDFRTRGGPDA